MEAVTSKHRFAASPPMCRTARRAAPLSHWCRGVQSAIVVGKQGEEIWTDKFGRVMVKFPWDRAGQGDENCAWVRVSHPWAGNRWGFVFLPRIGQEVIVDFVEGDPDQPIITGRVYNKDQMPPYDLPDNRTQSGIKSRSSKSGGPANFNEIRFEDKKGKEEVYIHAEKTMKIIVEGSETHAVGGKQSLTVKKDQTTTVSEGDRKVTVETGDDAHAVNTGDRSVDVLAGNDVLFVQAGNIESSAPAGTHNIQALNIEANGTAGVKITCGASSIELTPASIVVKAPMVKIN